ncbi:MAG: DUF3419 family protein [Phyllobacteriaceae bacterium]|nr:DUF3419 family protein [Phyllobacteriaceae bacterium]
MFSGLVYPMIWEDPDVDMDAMGLSRGDRVVTIASGGCNWLAYLERGPASIEAVDLNSHHVALSRLKQAAYNSTADDTELMQFFGSPGRKDNAALYDTHFAPRLDMATRAYWEGRDTFARRKITIFERNIHRTGLLGRFIAFGHAIARLNGVDPAMMLTARDLGEQKALFETYLAPLFDTALVQRGAKMPVSLFGLGIPPAQYDALLDGHGSMADVLKERVRKLACDSRCATITLHGWPLAAVSPRPAKARRCPRSTLTACPPSAP